MSDKVKINKILTKMGVAQKERELYINTIAGIASEKKQNRDVFVSWAMPHETGLFKRMIESTRYSETRARAVFGKRIPADFHWHGTALTRVVAEDLFNYVYGNRMGNAHDEGFMFRGRGCLHLTGKENYTKCAKYILSRKSTAYDLLDFFVKDKNKANIVSALWYWDKVSRKGKTCKLIANHKKLSLDDKIKFITLLINGGTNGLSHRAELTKKALSI